MTVDFKPHDSASWPVDRWLMQSGMLSKAEQLFLDSWMTRTSRDLRDIIGRECMRLEEIGVFDQMPRLRIIPQIETIAEVGARKFLVWAEKLTEVIPDFVRSGFRNLAELSISVKSEEDPFADVTRENKKPDYISSFRCYLDTVEKSGLSWKKPVLQSAIIVLGTPDLKTPLYASFGGMEAAVMFAVHHEIAHGSMYSHLTSDPIVTEGNELASFTDDADRTASRKWENDAWVSILSLHLFTNDPDFAALDIFQTRCSEYYADVGAALMHARAGYNTQYIEPFCKARESDDMVHQTHPVLRTLAQVLDFHPIVLNDKIDAFDLHKAIGSEIAPQIGHDLLKMMRLSPSLAAKMEQALPELVSNSQVESQGYAEMNEAFGGQFPKMALFFAKLVDGPEVDLVAQHFAIDQDGRAPSMT